MKILFISLFIILFSGCAFNNPNPANKENKEIKFLIPYLEVRGKAPFYSIENNNSIVGFFKIDNNGYLIGEVLFRNHEKIMHKIFDCNTGSTKFLTKYNYSKDTYEKFFIIKNKYFCFNI